MTNFIEYPKELQDNLRYRTNLVDKASKNEELQLILMKKCERDLMYFVNNFLWTYDPRLEIGVVPFITYGFQDEYMLGIAECVANSQDSITEKSRDMGFSWMIAGIILRGFLFKRWSVLIGSYKQDYVDSKGNMDSLFEKIRYMIDYLPKWMIPNDLNSYYMTINSLSLKSEIAGDAGINFGTGGRRTVVFMDEFALWENGEYSFRKTRDITRCRIIGGTPHGKLNCYGKIMTSHPDYCHLNIKKFRLHWGLHPKKTKAWYDEECKSRTRVDIAQELDISYDNSVSGAVYPDFQNQVEIGTYQYNPNMNTYTSWDFGRDMTAIIWYQKDWKTNKVYVIDAVKRKERNINKAVAFVTGVATNGYNYTKQDLEIIDMHRTRTYTNHFGDPYNGNSKTAVTDNTFKTVMQGYGIYLTLKRGNTPAERIRMTLLGLNRLCIDERCFDLIQDVSQARYPEITEGSNAITEAKTPIHDETSHFRTSLEYWFDNEPQAVRSASRKPRRVNPLTGQIILDI